MVSGQAQTCVTPGRDGAGPHAAGFAGEPGLGRSAGRHQRTGRDVAALARKGAAKQNLRVKTVTLTAHFDGERIRLDQPFALVREARLLVTVLPEPSAETELRDWLALSKAGLARAYADDEPDCPASLVHHRPAAP